MGDTLLGKEVSGTPMETRQGTTDLANMFQAFLQNGNASPMGKMQTESWINMLGFDPSMMGMDEAMKAALMDPADTTSGLFASMVPFENEAINQQTSQLSNRFGSMGARFSRGAGAADSRLRRDLTSGFARERQGALLTAAGLRNQALASAQANSIAARQAALQPLALAASFLQPGAAQQKEGILPGLLGAGMNIFGMMKMMQMMGGKNPGGSIPMDTRGGIGMTPWNGGGNVFGGNPGADGTWHWG